MGIVNKPDMRRYLDGLELITPHGDRKLFESSTWTTEPGLSLPLMGIVNPISGESDGSSEHSGDGSRYGGHGESPVWTRIPRLSPGAEIVFRSGAGGAAHTTDQFSPCQLSSC